jgi:glycosyltransferase involved in cell wall biosynthesis
VPRIALDATYGLGDNLSGVGVYSREILYGLARAHVESRFLWCYRAHRLLRSFTERLPRNASRRILHEPFGSRNADLFHGLNQRLPRMRLRAAAATFHDLFVLTGDYSSKEFRRRFELQARDAAARSDLIVTVSEFTARQVQELLGVERGRIRVVRHGVRVPGVPASGAREKIVLHVGAIQKRKNVARLVAAFESMPAGWRLVLAGSFGYGAPEILRRIEESPRRNDIEVAGYVSAERLAGLYASASVLAFPSLDEGFGMPALEAMAWGVPVLASNRSALPEVCGEAALLIDPNDTDSLACGLRKLALDEDLRGELVRRGRGRAERFTWEEAVAGTWNAYSGVLFSGTRRQPLFSTPEGTSDPGRST